MVNPDLELRERGGGGAAFLPSAILFFFLNQDKRGN